MKLNKNFFRLKDNYLFSEVRKRTEAFEASHPGKRVIRLSIGDVVLPLAPAVIAAMHRAVDELSRAETFRGYPPTEGYGFLRTAIRESYQRKGVSLSEDEIFVSDGAKSDLGNLPELFSAKNTVLIPDPVYPAYLDANILAGRRVIFSDATEENGFLPLPKGERADIIYLCSPNNPTGAAYSGAQLKSWVDYANARGAVILYDAAYEAFLGGGLPRSVYRVEGARECAVEICSFSKTAGFTGVRCGYAVVPRELKRRGVSLNRMWARRQSSKYNGTSFVTQMGAAASLSREGEAQTAAAIARYGKNAAIIAHCLDGLGLFYTGGKHSPYLWMKCPRGMGSWEFFDDLLARANVVGTPGCGFGKNGEGYFRLTSFGTEEDTREACDRIASLYR